MMSIQRRLHHPTSSQTLQSKPSRYISLTHSHSRAFHLTIPILSPTDTYTNFQARRVTITITSTITPPLVTATKRVFVTITKTVTCCPFNRPPPSNQQLVPRPHQNRNSALATTISTMELIILSSANPHGMTPNTYFPPSPLQFHKPISLHFRNRPHLQNENQSGYC